MKSSVRGDTAPTFESVGHISKLSMVGMPAAVPTGSAGETPAKPA